MLQVGLKSTPSTLMALRFQDRGFVPVRSALSSLAVEELHEGCVELHQAVQLGDRDGFGEAKP